MISFTVLLLDKREIAWNITTNITFSCRIILLFDPKGMARNTSKILFSLNLNFMQVMT